MSTKKTETYQFHLWEPRDSVLRTEFNENTLATERALTDLREHTDQSLRAGREHTDAEVAALRTHSDAKAEEVKTYATRLVDDVMVVKPELVFGTYMGDGSLSPRTLKLNYKPRHVLLFTQGGKTREGSKVYGGMASRAYPLMAADSGTDAPAVLDIMGSSIIVYGNGSADNAAGNVSGLTYYFLATH